MINERCEETERESEAFNHSYLIVLGKADDLNVEWLTGLEWESILFLFGAPAATLAWVSHGFALIEPGIEMEDNITASKQIDCKAGCVIIRSTLDVDHTS